jgi:superfamily I DNA and/or RNA helicase
VFDVLGHDVFSTTGLNDSPRQRRPDARLINVAVSRAKNHLIVLANLTYLESAAI